MGEGALIRRSTYTLGDEKVGAWHISSTRRAWAFARNGECLRAGFPQEKAGGAPYKPFAKVDLTQAPWTTQETSHTKNQEAWAEIQKHHKRPVTQTWSYQAWPHYYFRSILTGNICNAWETFGGISTILATYLRPETWRLLNMRPSPFRARINY